MACTYLKIKTSKKKRIKTIPAIQWVPVLRLVCILPELYLHFPFSTFPFVLLSAVLFFCFWTVISNFSISTHFIPSNNKPYLHYPVVCNMCFIIVYPNLNLIQDHVCICLLVSEVSFNIFLFSWYRFVEETGPVVLHSWPLLLLFFLNLEMIPNLQKSHNTNDLFFFSELFEKKLWHDAPSHPGI